MFKLLVEFSFANWFFNEAIERFNKDFHFAAGQTIMLYKKKYIDPLIHKMLAHAQSHPDYMTPQQKTELQTVLNDQTGESLGTKFPFARPLYILSQGDVGNSDVIEKNIVRSLQNMPYDQFATLDDMIAKANATKKGQKHSQYQINNVPELLNWLVINKAVWNMEKGLKGKGGAGVGSDADSTGGAEASTGSNVDDAIDAGQFDDDENAEMNQLRGNLLNKLDDCLRAYQSAKSTKYINEAEKVYDKVQNQAERGSGKIPWKDFGDMKRYSILSLLGKYINTVPSGSNSQGLDKTAFDKFKSAEKGALTGLVSSDNFKQFVANQLNESQPSADARLLVASTVVPACLMAIASRGPDQKMGPIVEQYKSIPFVSNSPEAQNLLNFCADITTNQQMKGKPATAKGVLSPTEVGGAVFDIDYPVTDINYQIERDFLDFQERYRAIINSSNDPAAVRSALFLGKDAEGNPIYLDLTKDCEDILDNFRKVGHI